MARDVGWGVCGQDGNKWIENEELHGFLKDLMELVQEVGQLVQEVSSCTASSV